MNKDNSISDIVRIFIEGVTADARAQCELLQSDPAEIIGFDTVRLILERAIAECKEDRYFCRLGEGAVQQLDSQKREILKSLYSYVRLEDVTEKEPQPQTEGGLPVTSERGYYWNLMYRNLERKFNLATVRDIDTQSDRVLRCLHDPNDMSPWRTMGLVVGQVQSGKTANYSSLIGKAADAGYRLIIVLSGIHNDLRSQTQERLDEEFTGYHRANSPSDEPKYCGVGCFDEYDHDRAPRCLTTLNNDFQGARFDPDDKPVLLVIKKNHAVLNNLKEHLKTIKDPMQWPLLMIDDEGDQASINTKENTVTVTNQFIRETLAQFPRASFVTYTATPFANIFIDSEKDHALYGSDLFPTDFIVRLKAPRNYFGPRQYFGNDEETELPLFWPVPREEAADWMPRRGRKEKKEEISPEFYIGEIPESVRNALLQFILSTAVRVWRITKPENHERHLALWEEDKPILESGMLVHVSYIQSEQKHIAAQFKKLVADLRTVFLNGTRRDKQELTDQFADLLQAQYAVTETCSKVRKEVDTVNDWSLPGTFDELKPFVGRVIEDLSVRLVNGEVKQVVVQEPAPESRERPYTSAVINIGGNKLSRGLTIPSLCMSVFLRTTTMYDTLLQMGRWFGYRDGYVDLCRIATTTAIFDAYCEITEALLDFEDQIDQMNERALTPQVYRLKVLAYPGLQITARNKMRTADEAMVSFNGMMVESRWLSLSPETLVQNARAAKALIDSANDQHCLAYASALLTDNPQLTQDPVSFYSKGTPKPEGRLWRNVPTDTVTKFLTGFKTGSEVSAMEKDAVADYVHEAGITRWNVFVQGSEYRQNGFGSSFIARRKMEFIDAGRPEARCHIRVLKSGGHEFIGVSKEVMDEAVKTAGPEKDKKGRLYEEVRRAAGRKAPDTGYLLIYLIDPKAIDNAQIDFDAVDQLKGELGEVPMAAYYLWLPEKENATSVKTRAFNSTVFDVPDEGEEE